MEDTMLCPGNHLVFPNGELFIFCAACKTIWHIRSLLPDAQQSKQSQPAIEITLYDGYEPQTDSEIGDVVVRPRRILTRHIVSQ